MPGALKPLGRGIISVVGTPTVLYTVPTIPPNTVAIIHGVWVVNTDTVTRLVTIQSGLSALGLGDTFFPQISIRAKNAIFIDGQSEMDIMGAGWTFQAYADVANVVAIRLFGEEVT